MGCAPYKLYSSLGLYIQFKVTLLFVEAPGLNSRFDGKVQRNPADLEFEERLQVVRR